MAPFIKRIVQGGGVVAERIQESVEEPSPDERDCLGLSQKDPLSSKELEEIFSNIEKIPDPMEFFEDKQLRYCTLRLESDGINFRFKGEILSEEKLLYMKAALFPGTPNFLMEKLRLRTCWISAFFQARNQCPPRASSIV